MEKGGDKKRELIGKVRVDGEGEAVDREGGAGRRELIKREMQLMGRRGMGRRELMEKKRHLMGKGAGMGMWDLTEREMIEEVGEEMRKRACLLGTPLAQKTGV